jgi:hypothetical protein
MGKEIQECSDGILFFQCKCYCSIIIQVTTWSQEKGMIHVYCKCLCNTT